MKARMKHVAIPNDYFFRMACRDYYDWRKALIREFIQNSVDAGATEIRFCFDGAYLTVADNGCGMDLDTIENALLTLGGTQKQGPSVGGLGKAKEILYFSWPEWEIRSGDTLVRGEGCLYEIGRSDLQKGVSSRIKIDNHLTDVDSAIRRYVSLCSLAKTTVYFNDAAIAESSVGYGKKVAAIDGLGDLYENTLGSEGSVLVNAHGLHMFSSYSVLDKSYVFDITMPSYECLTANRDGFIGKWNDRFDRMLGKMAIDTESSHLRKEHIIHVRDLRRHAETDAAEILKNVIDHPLGPAVAQFSHTEEASISVDDVQEYPSPHYAITEDLIDRASGKKLRSVIKIMKRTKLLNACLNWYRGHFPEGFIIVSERDVDTDTIYTLYARETLQLTILWKTIVDFIAGKADIRGSYGYGIVIADNTVARCQEEYILYNPFVFEDLDWDEAAVKMLIAASEELVHYVGYTYHNETFKCRFAAMVEGVVKERIDVDDFLGEIRKVRKG